MDHIWDNWSDDDDENDEMLFVERRQYKMQDRIDMDKWDDIDFIYRFRLAKATVTHVFQIIRPSLDYSQERYTD